MKIKKLPRATEVKGGETVAVVQDGETKQMDREVFVGTVPDSLKVEKNILHLTADGKIVGDGVDVSPTDWEEQDNTKRSFLKNKPFYKEEKEVDYTRLTLDNPVDESVAPGVYYNGKTIGLVTDTTYTVDIISAEGTISLQLTAFDCSSELGLPTGSIVGFESDLEPYICVMDGVKVELITGTPMISDDATILADPYVGIQSILIHGVKSSETVIKKLDTEFLDISELSNHFSASVTKSIYVDTPNFDNQPTITEASLHSDFKDWKTGQYYVAVNVSYPQGTFQLALSKTSVPIAQIFHLPNCDAFKYRAIQNGDFIEFSSVGADWKMRFAGERMIFVDGLRGYPILDFRIKGKESAFCTQENAETLNSIKVNLCNNTADLYDQYYQDLRCSYINYTRRMDNKPFGQFEGTCVAPTEKKIRCAEYEWYGTIQLGEKYIFIDSVFSNRPLITSSVTGTAFPNCEVYPITGYCSLKENSDEKLSNLGGLIIWTNDVVFNGTEIVITGRK